VAEFLGPLSHTSYCWPEEWSALREFDHVASGEKDRLAKLQGGEGEAAAPKKKKAGKK
jgi:hypothetical protein